MDRRFAPTLFSRRPPFAVVAAWGAASIGIAGLVLTHPAAARLQDFTAHARVRPIEHSQVAVANAMPGEPPALVSIDLSEEPPATVPEAPVAVVRVAVAAAPPPVPVVAASDAPVVPLASPPAAPRTPEVALASEDTGRPRVAATPTATAQAGSGSKAVWKAAAPNNAADTGKSAKTTPQPQNAYSNSGAKPTPSPTPRK
jgi:hypothetical protein